MAVLTLGLIRRFWPDYPAAPIRVALTSCSASFGLAAVSQPEMYLPMAYVPVPDAELTVRTTGDPLRLAGAIRREVLRIDPEQAASAVSTMQEISSTG